MDFFLAGDPVGNEIKLTECPGPELKKLIADGSVFLSEKEGKQNAWQVKDHEESEDKQHPNCVEF